MSGGKFRWLGFSGLVVLVLDLATKTLILAHFPLYSSYTLIPGFFRLVHFQNKGVAFGLLGGPLPIGRDLLLLLLPPAAVIGILVYVVKTRRHRPSELLALGGILGGALGNWIDRLRFGAVVDFLDFSLGPYHWPAFNVADSAITLGTLYLLIHYLAGRES